MVELVGKSSLKRVALTSHGRKTPPSGTLVPLAGDARPEMGAKVPHGAGTTSLESQPVEVARERR